MTQPNQDNINLVTVKLTFDLCIDAEQSQWPTLFAQSQCNAAEIAQVEELLSLAMIDQENPQHESIINKQLQDLGQNVTFEQRLGPYQIEREIGRGGMGIVFLAHRADGLYEQKVAIKITPSFASQEELQRFNLERQILAQLQHPNIAMLLDGGSTPDNRPFLVMEFISGQPITTYANAQKLNLQQRLTLFCDICEAVNFAHSCLIVHRDLKPENVLVTIDGQVKLLDFGVSKILQSEPLSTKTTIQQGLTLAYASPEQVKGDTTTTATDVYGLGALLYELLCGQRPHALKKSSVEEIIQNICLTDPALCSVMAKQSEHPVHFKSLRGDLDNIIRKAMRIEPMHRYASAKDMAQDIRRYLGGTPVIATPPSVSYKMAKFIRRHPASSSLATALGVALVGGLIVSLNLTHQLTQERVQLRQEVATSGQVIALLTDMFDAASPENAAGEDISIDKLLDTSVRKIRKSLIQQPQVKSRLLNVLSQVHNKIGKDQLAVTLMEEAYQLKRQQGDKLSAIDIAELGNAYRQASSYELAIKHLTQAEKMVQLSNKTNDSELALVDYYIGLYFADKGEPKQAKIYLTKAADYWQQFPDPKNIKPLVVRYNLAKVYFDLNELEQTIAILLKVVADTDQLFGQYHPQNVASLSLLANTYRLTDDSNKAEAVIARAYGLGKKILDPNNLQYKRLITVYSYFLNDQGKYQQAVEILSAEIDAGIISKRALGGYLTDRGAIYVELGYYQRAINDLEQALELLKPYYQDNFLGMFQARLQLAFSLGLMSQQTKAQQMFTQLYNEGLKVWPQGDFSLLLVKMMQAIVGVKQQDFALAQTRLEQVKSTFDQVIDPNHFAYIGLLRGYVELHMTQQQWSQALPYLTRAQAIVTANHMEDSLESWVLNLKQAEIAWYMGDKKQAMQLVNENAPKIKRKLAADSDNYQLAQMLEKLVKN